MDEAFMSRVPERIAAATEAVSSFSPTADPNKLPAVQTMDEWMASHSPATKHRCGDCKAPLVEGSTTICVACGRQLPPRLVVKREQFSFQKSLANKLFYESVNLEDPHDTSTDTNEELPLQPTGTFAHAFSDQQPRSATGFGVEEVERNVQGGERGNAVVSDAGDSITQPAPESKPLKVEEESEEYIWESADADDFGSQSWAKQLARDSGGDPKEVSPAINSTAFHSANNAFGQTSSTNADDFFAVAAISGDKLQSQSVETDFKIFFPPVSKAVDESRSEQANTTGPSSSSKDSLGPSPGTDFHDFFQNSALTDPKGQISVPEGSTGQTVKDNFDDFFHSAPTSTDESRRQNEETATRLSGEEFSTHVETDFDDFFQGLPKAADHYHRPDLGTPAPHTAEASSSHNIETDFHGFFQAVPESSGQSSGGQNVETHLPYAAEESSGQGGEFETDFDDFLQAAPKSADKFGGSTEETPSHHPAGDFNGQREEPDFDFFFQTTPVTANESRRQDVEEAAPYVPEKRSGQNLDTDFSFFFQAGPVSGGPSRNEIAETDARDLTKESSGQKVDNHFDVFEAALKPADKVHPHNVETPISISSDEGSSQGFRMEFDDFFLAAPVLAGPSPGENVNGAEFNEVEEQHTQYIETDFDDFFAGAPKRANGSGGHNAGADFDFFFQTPSKSKDKLHGQHTQSDVPDSQEKSNGDILEPGFAEFFPSANDLINLSHGQNVKTVAPKPAEESPGQIVETDFEDFFQGAHSVDKSNGHSAVGHFDFFRPVPQGQNASMASDSFFPTDRQSVGKSYSKNESGRDFDPFHQAVPSSMNKSLDQNGATDLDNGEFDDFVQAAPRSADEVVGPSQITQYDSFLQQRPRSVNNPQQILTTDFDDFFQAAPQTADKSANVITGSQVDNFKTSHPLADWAHHRKESIDFGSLFQVAPPGSSSGPFAHGNGSDQTTQAEGSPISTMTQSWSSNGDILSPLEGLHIPQDPLQGYQEPQKKTPNDLSDLSFRLADHLVISDEAATNMWSFN